MGGLSLDQAKGNLKIKAAEITGFIQARLCKIQGLFKDFYNTFILFSRTENL